MDRRTLGAVVFDVGNTLWFEARRPDIAEIEHLQAERLVPLLAAWGLTLSGPADEIVRAVHEAGDEAMRIEEARGTLREVSIAPYVHAVVCSGDTGYVKPHPSTFEFVLDRLGVAPHEALMVGDSAQADMRGAKAVGMCTVWKLNGRYDLPPCPDADYAIHDLAELLSLPIIPRGARQSIAAESLTPHDDGNEDRY